MIAVAVAATITGKMVSRNEENTGFLITKWVKIVQAVGADYADDVGSANDGNP